MDECDINILNLLQSNSRITMSDIGHQVNLSIPAVSDRLKKLESTGIIDRYTAILNSTLMKKNLTAIMFISLAQPKYNIKFTEFVMAEDEILECNYLAGDYDFALKIVTEGTATLENLLNKIKSIQGVQKTKTIVVLSTIKNNYSVKPGTCV
ncbi:MAG TPA: Lrp/AsnC family transcriptional regulator [Clostridia bacterium]|nr:Lrp/AsnC family transcriptional regulator [Clostridia bacterium]